jgi:hypothetical protein
MLTETEVDWLRWLIRQHRKKCYDDGIIDQLDMLERVYDKVSAMLPTKSLECILQTDHGCL